MGGEAEGLGVAGFSVFAFGPAGDVGGVAEFGERFEKVGFEFGGDGDGVDFSGFFGRLASEGFALDELALDGKKRCENVVAGLQVSEFFADMKECADEVFDVGREFDDEVGALFGGESFREIARAEEPVAEARFQLFEKAGVEEGEAGLGIQIGKRESKGRS